MVHQDIFRNGKKLVSVTELTHIIAKPFLEPWKLKLCHCKTHATAKKSAFKPMEQKALEQFGQGHCGNVYADAVKDGAGDLGNEVHELVEQYFQGFIPDTTARTEASVWAEKIIATYKEHNVKPAIIKPEENMIDADSGLAGSPDTIGEWDGRIEILDTKIKNSLDELTGMQGMGYRYLLNRKFNKDIRYMRAIWCQKATVGQLVKPVLIDLNEWIEPWRALVCLWNTINPRRLVYLHLDFDKLKKESGS